MKESSKNFLQLSIVKLETKDPRDHYEEQNDIKISEQLDRYKARKAVHNKFFSYSSAIRYTNHININDLYKCK